LYSEAAPPAPFLLIYLIIFINRSVVVAVGRQALGEVA
jgi:hypothetical protein